MKIVYRNPIFIARHFAVAAMLLCLCALIHFVAGCESTATPKNSLAKQVKTLTQDKREMMRQIEKLESENKDHQKQINTLHSLPDDVKIKDIYEVQSIRITKYTNLFDKDKDGKRETLIVYIQPVDQEGDIIKVPADVHIQLLDLDKDPVVLGKWHITPDQLRKLWFNALMKTHYRLTFDVADKLDSYEEPLTVMVTFTDYLTGREFNEQKLIKPN
ncbi:MAG: hypothetical protein ACYSR9_00370 [Planctomycetota bacterium]|jgi:hypothetical protein